MASTQKKRSLDQTLRPITAYHHPSPPNKKGQALVGLSSIPILLIWKG